jgi:hypothetical protein
MKCAFNFTSLMAAALLGGLAFGCATREPALPPARVAPPAAAPAEVERALPGAWIIDVADSADALARTQFQPRQVTVLRREGDGPAKREATMVTAPFDPKAFREARDFWLATLAKPDMQWRLVFKPDGTGEHWAVVQTGSGPVNTPFTWHLDGWRLHVEYPSTAKFHSFEREMSSADELDYPMEPLGDHLVLRRKTP